MKGKKKEQLYLKQDYDDYHFSLKEFLKYLGTVSYASCSCILSEMAEETTDQGAQKEIELSV